MNNDKIIKKMIEIARKRAKKNKLSPIEEMAKAISIVVDKDKWNSLEKQAKKELKKK